MYICANACVHTDIRMYEGYVMLVHVSFTHTHAHISPLLYIDLTEPPVKGEVESVEKLFGGLPVEPPCGPTLPFSDEEEEEEGLNSSPIISEGLREVQDIIGSLSSHSMSDLSGSPHHTTQGVSEEPLQASSSGEAIKDDSIR